MSEDVRIANLALSKCRRGPIASFTDGTPEAVTAGLWYEPTSELLRDAHPWNFATARSRPAPLAEAAQAPWAKVWLKPSAARVLAVLDERGHPLEYEVIGDRIHTGEWAIILLTYALPAAPLWPSWFRAAVIDRMAAEMAPAFDVDIGRWRGMVEAAEMTLRRAKSLDSQEGTTTAVDTSLLIAVR